MVANRWAVTAAILLLIIMQALTWPVALAQPVEPKLSTSPTRVYGLFSVGLPEAYTISQAVVSESRSLVVVAGAFLGTGVPDLGYIAGIDLDSLRFEWRQSLEGLPLIMAAESSDPRWVAVATDAGEIALVDVESGSVRAVFYTASRSPVIDLYLTLVGETPVIVAVDEEGFAYIYALGSESWVELGPSATSIAAVHYYTPSIVKLIDYIDNEGSGRYILGNVILAATSTLFEVGEGTAFSADAVRGLFKGLTGSVEALVFYRSRTGALVPAIPSSVEEEEAITVTKLFVSVHPPEGSNIVLPAAPGEEAPEEVLAANEFGLYELESERLSLVLPAATVTLRLYYTIEVIDRESGRPAGFDCFSTSLSLKLSPGEERDLNIVVLEPVDPLPGEWNLSRCLEATGFKPVVSSGESPAPVQAFIRLDLPAGVERFSYEENVDMVFVPLPGGSTPINVESEGFIVEFTGGDKWLFIEYQAVLGDVGGVSFLLSRLTDSLHPVLESSGVEYVRADITEVSFSPDGSFIVLGLGDGKILMVERGGSSYTKTRSLVIDTAPVTSIALLEEGSQLIAASAEGVMQLVDLEAWEPLWRGLPELAGVRTGLQNPSISVAGDRLVISEAMPEGSSREFYVMMLGRERELIPVYVQLSLELARPDGSREALEVPPGSEARILGGDGSVLAVDVFEAGSALVYVPRGEYTLEVEVTEGPASGTITTLLVVEPPFAVKSLSVGLREVRFTVVAAREAPSPELEIAYKLFQGPKEGVTVTAVPAGYDEGLGYEPQPRQVSSVTGQDGRVSLILWEGVRYEVVAEAPFIQRAAVTVDEYAAGEVMIEVHPRVFRVDIVAVDSDAAEAGVRYRVEIDEISVELRGGEARVEGVSVGGETASILLPMGEYVVSVKARGYYEASTLVSIDGSREVLAVEVPLAPMQNDVLVNVVVEDDVGLARGPLQEALVVVELVEPPLEGVVRVSITDLNGSALFSGLRTGLYVIRVEDRILGFFEFGPFFIYEQTSISLVVRPELVELGIRLVDGEFGVDAVGSFEVTLSYVKTSSSVSVEVEGPGLRLSVPKGVYLIEIVSTSGFYQPASQLVEASEDLSLQIELEPVYTNVVVNVVYDDDKTGIAIGRVPGALVSIELLEPALPVEPVSAVTGPDGRLFLKLRPGVYEISVEGDVIEPAESVIAVAGEEQVVNIKVRPVYGVVSISVIDSEMFVKIPGAQLRITWLGTERFSKTFIASQGELALELPLGAYLIEARIPEYYRPQSLAVEVLTERQEIVLLLEPVIVRLPVTVFLDESSMVVGDQRVRLPSIPLEAARIVVEPDDPLLEALGVSAVEAETGPQGVAIVELRAGRYKVSVVHEFSQPVELNLLVREGVTGLTVVAEPIVVRADLMVVDPELQEGFSTVSGVSIIIQSYNGRPVGASISYPGLIEAVVPAGVYEVIVDAEGYLAEAITVTVTPGDEAIVIELAPVKVQVSVTLLASTPTGESAPVLEGFVVMESIDLPLKERRLSFEISRGTAIATLRPGLYTVYYLNPALGINVQVSLSVEVTGATSELVIEFEPPMVDVAVEVVDGELGGRVAGSVITVSYSGPFGSWTVEELAAQGIARLSIPPGLVSLIVSADGYYESVIDLIALPGSPLNVKVSLDPILYTVELRLIDPDGRPVEEPLRVAMTNLDLGKTVEVEGRGPLIRVEEVRAGRYAVTITPLQEETVFRPTTVEVAVRDPGVVEPSVITVEYRLFTVEIRLVDSRTGKDIVFPYTLRLEREGSDAIAYPREVVIEAGAATIALPPGTYTATLQPVREDYYQVGEPVSFEVDSDETVVIRLQPRLYALTVQVVDDRGSPIPEALVRVIESERGVVATGSTDEAGRLVIQLPYGTYVILVSHPGYREAQVPVVLPQVTLAEVQMDPTIRTLAFRYGPIFLGVVSLSALIVLIYRVREVIAERLLKEEEYF